MNNQSLIWLCPTCKTPFTSYDAPLACQHCTTTFQRQGNIIDMQPGFSPEGFLSERRIHLTQLEREHFWFEPRAKLLEKKLAKLIGKRTGALIELGSGNGRFLPILGRYATQVVGVEGHIESLQLASVITPQATLVHSDVLHVPFTANQFDGAIMLDVLEHTDPFTLLSEARRLVNPQGILLLSVPSFVLLWSKTDELAGHRCRYRINQLRQELSRCGWSLLGHTHYQFLLFPVIVASRLLNRNSAPHLERTPPHWLNGLLRYINHFEVSVLGNVTLPWGSSLIAWARRQD